MSESLPVKVTVSSEELREWAGRHADAGHHGVAHVLYKAAAGVETIVEQYERERVAQPPTDANKPPVRHWKQQGGLGREDRAN